jgi:hypothetical protein
MVALPCNGSKLPRLKGFVTILSDYEKQASFIFLQKNCKLWKKVLSNWHSKAGSKMQIFLMDD